MAQLHCIKNDSYVRQALPGTEGDTVKQIKHPNCEFRPVETCQ